MTRRKVEPDAQLAGCPAKPAYFDLPIPVHERLDVLVDIATDSGYPASRKELVSALIFDAAEDGLRLGALLTRFRAARAREAGVAARPDATVLVDRPHKPGRRRRGRR